MCCETEKKHGQCVNATLTGIERGYLFKYTADMQVTVGRKFNRDKSKGQRSEVHLWGECERLSKGTCTCLEQTLSTADILTC